MTTAHRPTWKAAVGRANEGGWTAGGALSSQTSNLDAPAHTKLKFRKEAIDRKAALAKSLLALNEAEKKAGSSSIGKRQFDPLVEKEAETRLLKQTAEVDEAKLKEKGYDDSDIDDGGGDDDSSSSSESDLDAEDSDDNSDSDDDDDEAALQAELAKIRAEREESKRQAEEQEAEEEMAKQEEAALLGNPLLAGTTAAAATGRVKRRRWNEDVVFRNQAKGEPKLKKRFINDTVRNDFHKRFLNKFIR